MDRILTLSQAARHLRIAENTLRKWADSGVLRILREGAGPRLFLKRELDRLRRREPWRFARSEREPSPPGGAP